MQQQLQRNSSEESSFFLDRSERWIKLDENKQDQSELRLFSLKNQIQLSKSQLIEIINSQRYQSEAMSLNRKGIEMITEGQVAEAIILISQAQKILECAADSGKQINRNAIISVLHNLACCHQQTWSLQKCSNYVEALIYNLNCQIKQITDNSNENRLIAVEEVIRNRDLAKYYLLYCAINSQLKRNDAALVAAKKGNYLLKNSSVILAKLASKSRIGMDSTAIDILNELGRLKTSAQDYNVEQMIDIANSFMYVWKNRCSFPNVQLKALAQKLKDFSIGNFMQIQPRGPQLFDKLVWSQLTYQKVLQRVVIFSATCFTMATELRVLAVRMSNGNKQKARQVSEFRQSLCYHLISIILLLYYLPFDLLFIQHILTSFKLHYDFSIEPHSSNSNPKTLFSKFLQNDEKDEIKGSTAMNFNCDRGHSLGPSRNSSEQPRNSHLNLQSDVNASLKGQNFQHKKEMAKLKNYYYIRQQNLMKQKSKQNYLKSNTISNQSSKKNILRRACATSKQSAQKTPLGYTPTQRSPRKNKIFSKSSKSGLSSKNSSLHKFVLPSYAKKISNVIDEYFTTQNKGHRKKSRRKAKNSKSKKCKQNIQLKGHQFPSSNPAWKANNLLNRQESAQKSKQKGQIKGLKSPGKLNSKLEEAKSKKKFSKLNNYQ